MQKAHAAMVAELMYGVMTFVVWFLAWAPIVALLEYVTHRWIMHKSNRWLDPSLSHLRDHMSHHKGSNDHEHIDMSVWNGIRLTSPFLGLLLAWGLVAGPIASVAIPGAALLSWSFFYTYLWNRMHFAIHGVEVNWFRRLGPVFRMFRNHHLTHHGNAKGNYGTVFPWTDYVFFTHCKDTRTPVMSLRRETPSMESRADKKTLVDSAWDA